MKTMKQPIIPAAAIITETKAAECEKKSANEPELRETELREEAKLYQEWAKSLRSGRWTS
jgi:hypothetical protein